MAAWEQESVKSLQARHASARATFDYQALIFNAAARAERILAAQVKWALTKPGRLNPSIAEAQYDAALVQL